MISINLCEINVCKAGLSFKAQIVLKGSKETGKNIITKSCSIPQILSPKYVSDHERGLIQPRLLKGDRLRMSNGPTALQR